jgi:hypothetical protein
MNDNHFSIRDASRNDGVYRGDNDAKKAKPTNTNASRSFKNVLDKDDESKGSSSAKISKKPSPTSDEDESTTLSSVEDEEGAEQTAFSLFMQRKSKVKLAKEPAPQTNDDELIAEAEVEVPKAKSQQQTQAQPQQDVTPFVPKEKVLVNDDVVAKEMPKNIEKKMPELAVAQQTIVQVPEKKELPNLYSLNRPKTTASTSKEKADVDSPAALLAKQNKDNIGISVDEDGGGQSNLGGFADEAGVAVAANSNSTVGQKKENVVNPYAREKQDISAVNPQGMIQPVNPMEVAGSVAAAPKPVQASATLQALIEQLVKEITVMTKEDKTETTLTLSQPPLFAGAQVTMTGFDSARGQVNITFANLTQNAQVIVQQQQQNLLAGLEAKGYQVHIFVATTAVNEPVIAKAEINKDQRGRGEGGQEQEKRQNPQG